mgnify:CR=1 FL=1
MDARGTGYTAGRSVNEHRARTGFRNVRSDKTGRNTPGFFKHPEREMV